MGKRPVRALHIGIIVGLMVLGAVRESSIAWPMGPRVPMAGMLAEDFHLTDLHGDTHSLTQYRGKIVLLNFWATWCKPCTMEMPAMQTCYERLRNQGFVVLAINELEDDAEVRRYVEQYGHTFPVLMDRDNKVANQFGVYGLPVSVFIDEKGIVQEYIKGGVLTMEKIDQTVQHIQNHRPTQAVGVR